MPDSQGSVQLSAGRVHESLGCRPPGQGNRTAEPRPALLRLCTRRAKALLPVIQAPCDRGYVDTPVAGWKRTGRSRRLASCSLNVHTGREAPRYPSRQDGVRPCRTTRLRGFSAQVDLPEAHDADASTAQASPGSIRNPDPRLAFSCPDCVLGCWRNRLLGRSWPLKSKVGRVWTKRLRLKRPALPCSRKALRMGAAAPMPDLRCLTLRQRYKMAGRSRHSLRGGAPCFRRGRALNYWGMVSASSSAKTS